MLGLVPFIVSGCQEAPPEAAKAPVRVRAADANPINYAPVISLTGVIAARTENNLSFRTGGRVAERLVEVGDHVDAGALLARIDPQEQESDLRSAQAAVDASEAQLRQTTAAFERQKTLLTQGFTRRREYDQAQQAMQVAQGTLQSAESQLQNARDAVFNVNEALVANNAPKPEVTITLLANPTITAKGEIREVAPVIDPGSGTIKVKVAIPNTPVEMPLGAAVAGSATARPAQAIILPWQALFSDKGKPAVWTIDRATKAVSLTPVTVTSYNSGTVAIGGGLAGGQQVVTAGGQLLRPGQIVEIAEGEPAK